MKFRPFTLIELVVVLSVLAMVSALAVATLRGESPARTLDKGALEFAAFCAGVRFRAVEEGVDWKLCFSPDSRYVFAEPDGEEQGVGEAENANSPVAEDPSRPGALRWKLPDRFELDSEGMERLFVGDVVELFRFFGGGGAGGGGTFTLKCGELSRSFFISKLSGELLEKKESDER